MLAVSTAAVRHVLAQPHLSSVVWTNRHIVEFAAFSVADGGRGRDHVVAPVFWNEENAISVCGDDIAGCNFKLSERFANSPHRGATAVPAATALAVNVKPVAVTTTVSSSLMNPRWGCCSVVSTETTIAFSRGRSAS